MSRVGWFTAWLLIAQPLLSQIATNSVTVTATQSASVQPDVVILAVTVNSGPDKGLDDIVAAVQSVGINASNFAWLGFPSPVPISQTAKPQPQLEWNFQLPIAITKVKDTSAALAALAQSISADNSGLSLTFSAQGTQVSSSQTPTCSVADLIANARTQAQQLTSAAGLMPGMILALSTSTLAPCYLTVRFAIGTVLVPPLPNSITITASRTLTLQPDQISVGLNVTSGVNTSVDDITAALQQAGISGVVLNSLYTTQPLLVNGQAPQNQLQWSFTFTAPVSKWKDTISALLAAQQALPKASPPLSLTATQLVTQVSTGLVNSTSCPDQDLVKDARAQAQSLATAAGVSAGAILSLSNGGVAATPAFVNRLGNFSVINGAGYASVLLGGISVYPNAQGVTCATTVSFQLL
ncbi:MAG TPA: hypothetical protein VKT49_25085 [Bryobacteraceae bacterium]|nr:hypothetical protein [Bryobacteraceae bacterium]